MTGYVVYGVVVLISLVVVGYAGRGSERAQKRAASRERA